MVSIEWLNNWYRSNCNGDWEHSYGVKIDTLDNPGWEFRADLVDTPHEGKTLIEKRFISDTDWYNVTCNGKTFDAIGDTTKLGTLIDVFKNLIENQDLVSVETEDS